MDYPVSNLIPAAYLEFERDPKILRYEDEYIVAIRNANGAIEMTGKPFPNVFIYKEEKS